MLKVAILDDSKTARAALRKALEREPEILVVGEASCQRELDRVIRRVNPDLLCIDVYLESENGIDVTRHIMETAPRPVVLVTGSNTKDPQLAFKALECGALEVFSRLPAATHFRYEALRRTFVNRIIQLAKVPVLHRRKGSKRVKTTSVVPSTPLSQPPLSRTPSSIPSSKPPQARRLSTHPLSQPPLANSSLPKPPHSVSSSAPKITADSPKAVLLGASTGGPPIILQLLKELSKPFPVPVIVVQHISDGFAAGFAKWLSKESGHQTQLVSSECFIKAGTVYVAPDNQHIQFQTSRRLATVKPDPTDKICPSIDILFSSASRIPTCDVLAVLFTGMGRDGAEGLKLLREKGNKTIAQSPKSCTVSSMPDWAIKLDGAVHVLPPELIANTITTSIKRRV